MNTPITPQSGEEVAAAVAEAITEERPLEVIGRGSKRGLGRPGNASFALDLSALSGITLYEPEELVLSADAGTPLAEIEAAVAANGQMLAFEPPDLGRLLGGPPDSGSIGGVIACNLAGPRRIKAGGARDHFLGVTAVSGRGETFKSGGRVVKNVTGYDLMKLLAGSYGTLAVMTSVTLKVLPKPEKTYSVLLHGLDVDQASQALTRALASPHEVSGAVYLPAPLAKGSAVPYVADSGDSVTAIRVEGPGPSVQHRTAALRGEFANLGRTEELHSQNSADFWREVRDLAWFCEGLDRLIWRLSVPPSQGPSVISTLMRERPELLYAMDWGGGLIWLSLPPTADDGHAGVVRKALPAGNGHATLIRAPNALRAAAQVFQPQPAPLAALTRRLKDSFDPMKILNPGRMYKET